jgi:hypothetical protein
LNNGNLQKTNLVKGEKGDLLADSRSILNRQNNHLCQLLNMHGGIDVKQTEICMLEPLVPQPSAFEVKMATEDLKRNKLPSTDYIKAELS